MAIDVDRLVGLIEDAAIRYAGGCPVDFRPAAKEIAGIVLEEAAKVCDEESESQSRLRASWLEASDEYDDQANECQVREELALKCANKIRALAKGVE